MAAAAVALVAAVVGQMEEEEEEVARIVQRRCQFLRVAPCRTSLVLVVRLVQPERIAAVLEAPQRLTAGHLSLEVVLLVTSVKVGRMLALPVERPAGATQIPLGALQRRRQVITDPLAEPVQMAELVGLAG